MKQFIHGWEGEERLRELAAQKEIFLTDQADAIFNDPALYLEALDSAYSGEILGNASWATDWNVEEIRLRDGERANDIEMIREAVTGRRDLMLKACRAYAEWREEHEVAA